MPSEIIAEYFNQKHFSLKSFIANLLNAPKIMITGNLHIIHTRTDSTVLSLPSVSVEQGVGQGLSDTACQTAQLIICQEVDLLVVEQLSSLKSEASLRSAVDSWAAHDSKKIFLLVVDMSEQYSTNRVNFVRTVVEQRISGMKSKMFLLLLHYPLSSSYQKLCYPALFLGGWKHIFLDEVGNDSQDIAANKWIETACICTDDYTTFVINPNKKNILKKALTYTASQNLFYPGQLRNDTLFSDRMDILVRVMNKTVEGQTISDTLSGLFLNVWKEQRLLATLKRASDGLLLGTTQLSMCSSLRSMFQETFNAFFASAFCEINQWRNIDIVLNTASFDNTTEKIFGRILRSLSVVPVDELVLRRNLKGRLRPIPVGVRENCSGCVLFPFFYLISSSLDKILEMAEAKLHSEHRSSSNEFDLMASTMALLQSLSLDPSKSSTSSHIHCTFVAEVLLMIKNNGLCKEDSLFHRYLSQYTQWKLCCDSGSMIIDWLLYKIAEIGFSDDRNIIIIHIVAKKHGLELIRLASWSEFNVQRLPDMKHIPDKDSRSIFMALGNELLHFFTSKYESSLKDFQGFVSEYWLASFTTFLWRVNDIINEHEIDEIIEGNLRVLMFFHQLGLSTAPTDVIESAFERIYKGRDNRKENQGILNLSRPIDLFYKWGDSGETTHSTARLDVFMQGTQKPAAEEKAYWLHQFEDLMIRRFFSAKWLRFFKKWKESDFLYLLKMVKDKRVDQQVAKVLIQNVCKLKDQTLVYDLLNVFCKEVEDEMPFLPQSFGRSHFVPDWIAVGEEKISQVIGENNEVAAYFSNYHPVKFSPMTSVMFEAILNILLYKEMHSSSEEILLKLTRDMKAEFHIDFNESDSIPAAFTKAFEIISSMGFMTFAMNVDARLVCYVAKVSWELAMDAKAAALCGAHGEMGHYVLELVMSLDGYKWQEFFFNNIIRLKGVGNLLTLLGVGGALHNVSWCQKWVLASPTLKTGAEQSLKKSEDDLAEALREEEKKRQDLRLCPNCRGEFSVHNMGCGQFVCGQNAHGMIGTSKERYGCGTSFNINVARYYEINEELLSRLRKKVDEERAHLRECKNATDLLERAEKFKVPIMLHVFEDDIDHASFVPCSVISTSIVQHKSTTEENVLNTIIKSLFEERRNADLYSYLPDFIEVS
jgi:hypothetical protein